MKAQELDSIKAKLQATGSAVAGPHGDGAHGLRPWLRLCRSSESAAVPLL